MKKAPYWLAKYGWYYSLNNIMFGIIMTIIIATIVCAPIYAIPRIDSFYGKDAIKTSNTIMKITLTITGIIILVIILGFLIPCFISPELVGAKALINLLRS